MLGFGQVRKIALNRNAMVPTAIMLGFARYSTKLLTFVLLFSGIETASSLAAETALSAAEIRSVISGNSLTGYWQNAELKQHFAKGGQALSQRERGEVVAGRWHMDRERHLLCTSYPTIEEAHCYTVQRRGAKLVLFEHETGYPLHATVIKGNVLAGVAAAPDRKRGSGIAPPGAIRTHVTRDDLFAATYLDDGPVHNAYFMPVGDAASARHEIRGRLTVPDFALLGRLELGQGYGWFPGFSVDFFSHDGRLVPLKREIIRPAESKSNLALILSPGRIWSEPGDGDLSRASFPFVLATTTTSNAHNGIASFLFSDSHVSALRVQVVQETAPAFKLDAWGQGGMSYQPHQIDNLAALRRRYQSELARQTPIRPWSELTRRFGSEALADFDPYTFGDDLSVAGLIVDGAVYAMPCRSRFGDFPYCAEMRHGASSLSKTLGAALTLLWLAQKYGDWVFDLRIKDYVDVTARHAGWARVTFADALNMATGIGDRVPPFRTADDSENARGRGEAQSAREKLRWAFKDGNYAWGPGKRFRFRTGDTLVLAAAMDAFLKRQEGPNAALWRSVQREVLEPIGVYHLPARHSLEANGRPGIPLLGFDLYPTIDDIAKIAELFRNRGRHNGKQLVHPAALEEIFDWGRIKGLPSSAPDRRYHMSFWLWSYRDFDTACTIQIPYAQGFGGQLLVFLPNGMTAFRFADNQKRPIESMARVANRLKPFCP